MYVCIWIRYILLETTISYMWLWTIWLWIHSNTQPMGNKIYFVRNYAFIYVIMNNLTMNSFWYPSNGGYSLVFWYPNQWGLFIGILIPNQWGLLIGILIPKPMGVIHWYSDVQSRGYSVTIVIRLLRIWITFEYLNCFESLKLHIWFWKCLNIWTILSP